MFVEKGLEGFVILWVLSCIMIIIVMDRKERKKLLAQREHQFNFTLNYIVEVLNGAYPDVHFDLHFKTLKSHIERRGFTSGEIYGICFSFDRYGDGKIRFWVKRLNDPQAAITMPTDRAWTPEETKSFRTFVRAAWLAHLVAA